MSINPLNEREIRYQVSQITELPPLPRSIERLIEIIHSEVESPEEIQSILRYDQSLTAKILLIANSTYYGCRGKVSTLSKALMVIGFNQVKSICICTLLLNLLSSYSNISLAHRELLWKHSFACSKIAAEIAKKRPWISCEEASMLGLIHDIGWLVMATYFNEQFGAIIETAAKRNVPPWLVEMQHGLFHTQLGKYLVSRWTFPEVFKAVVEFHHCPERSTSFKTEVGLIYLANVLSHSREYPELVNEELTLSQCRELYIPEEEWQGFQEGIEQIWSEVDQLWNLLG